MPGETNKQVVLAYVEAFNRADMDALRRLFTEDAKIHGVLGVGGMDVVIEIWQELHRAFALRLKVEDIVCEGDTVAVRYTESGESVGEFRGQPPTGKPYEIPAMEWFQLRDGRIHRRWGARDFASMMGQMGMTAG